MGHCLYNDEKVAPVRIHRSSWLNKHILHVLYTLYKLLHLIFCRLCLFFLPSHTTESITTLINNLASKSPLKAQKTTRVAEGESVYVTYDDFMKQKHHLTVEWPFNHSTIGVQLKRCMFRLHGRQNINWAITGDLRLINFSNNINIFARNIIQGADLDWFA